MLDSLTDKEIFQKTTDGFKHYDQPCPKCGATGSLSRYGSYHRWLVYRAGEKIASELAQPLRFECKSCGTTHALLPDILTPYSPYSLRFKIIALIGYLERETTVAMACEGLGIAISTLYEWKKLLLSHKGLMLGALVSQKTPALAFLQGLLPSGCLSGRLQNFFRKYAFSFMQKQPATATQIHPP